MSNENEIFDARVQNGIAKLNAVHGTNWADKIDVTKLDLSDSDTCVLGQVYGAYVDGLRELGLSVYGMDAQNYGFTTIDSGDPSNEKIQAAWLRVLKFEDGTVMEADGWNATWSYLRIHTMCRVNDKTYYVVQPGDLNDKGEFCADTHKTPRIYTASSLLNNYKRHVPAPKQGSIVKTESGSIYYIGKDKKAWRIDAAATTWINVASLGKTTALNTVMGVPFNTETH